MFQRGLRSHVSTPPNYEDPRASPPTTGPDAPTTPALEALATHASLWTVASMGGSHVLRFVSNLVLTRLLHPQAFGMMTLVNSVYVSLQLMSDVGLRYNIVRHPRGADQAFIDTVWTVQVLRGIALALVAALLAWPLAQFYEEPAYFWVLSVTGLNSVIAGFASVSLMLQDRKMSLRATTLINLGSIAGGAILMIVWASLEASVWALVAGGLFTTAARTVMSHLLLPSCQTRFRVDPGVRRDLVRFGRWIFVSTLTVCLASQADRLMLGKMIPPALLGIYGISVMITMVPVELVGSLTGSVTLPLYSRLSEQGADLQRAYTRSRRLMLTCAGALLSALIITAPTLIDVLYDNRYAQAGQITQILAVGAWFNVLSITNGDMLLALWKPQWTAAGNFAKVLCFPFAMLAFSRFGLTGALVVLALSEIPRYVVVASRVRASGLHGWGLEGGLSLALALCAVLAALLHVPAVSALDLGIKFVIAGIGYLAVWGRPVLALRAEWHRGVG
jgi:O-antigen/teichoic acid export membrane protein